MITPEDINKIKISVKNILNLDSDFKSNFIKCYSTIDEDSKLKGVTFPIFYLFDAFINDGFGSNSLARSSTRKLFKLDEIFCIDPNNIIDLNIDKHATILYKFMNEGRRYIYYSNSGLGIGNQFIIPDNGLTACKIYYCKDEQIWNDVPLKISKLIDTFVGIPSLFNVIYTLEKSQYFMDNSRLQEFILKPKDKGVTAGDDTDLYNYLNFLSDNSIGYFNIKPDTLILNIKFILTKLEEKDPSPLIDLCYTLLTFLTLEPNKKTINCTFNHVLTGSDDEYYISKTNNDNIKYNNNFISLYNNKGEIQEKNEKNYMLFAEKSLIITQPSDLIKFEKFITSLRFQQFVISFKKEIERISEFTPTLKFKKLDIEYNLIMGIFNYQQKSGSCTFYSYYNLALNMLILCKYNLFIKDQSNKDKYINEIVTSYITFHYKMMYIYCLTQDTEAYLIDSLHPNNFNNDNFIYKLIIENNLLDEINDFYPKNTFILNPSKLIIDKYLDFSSENAIIKIKDKNNIINNLNIFKKFKIYRNNILFNIRSGKEIKDTYIDVELMDNNQSSKLYDIIKSGSFDFSYIEFKEYFEILKHINLIYFKILKNFYKNEKIHINDDNIKCISKMYYLDICKYKTFYYNLKNKFEKVHDEFHERDYKDRQSGINLFDTQDFLFNKLNDAEKNYISTIITNPEALKIYTNDKYNTIYENIIIKMVGTTFDNKVHNEYEIFPLFKYNLNEDQSKIDTYTIYNYFMGLIDDINYKEYIKEQIPTLKDELKIKTNTNKESYEIIIKNIINENINKLKLLLNSYSIIDCDEF